jgi:hypothetical protein
MMLPIALTAAGAAALVNFWLSLRCATIRSARDIWIGDGGDARLTARMRAHSNFAEYTPVVLILIALVEWATGSPLWLAIVAGIFVLGRILHALGMDGWRPGRFAGMLFTAPIMIGLALYAVAIPWLHQAPPASVSVTAPAATR